MGNTKDLAGRVRDLESWAFRTGEDLTEIKQTTARLEGAVDDLRIGVDDRFSGIETTLVDHGMRLARMESVQTEHTDLLKQILAKVNDK